MNKLLVFLCSVLILYSCSDHAGGSIEVSNGFVAGTLYHEDSTLMVNQELKLYPANFNPISNNSSDVVLCTTSTSGTYIASIPEKQAYNLIARSADNLAVIQQKISVNKNDTIDIAPLYLSKTGTIKINSESLTEISGSVYVEGTDLFASVTDDTVVISGIPSSNSYTIIHEKATNNKETLDEDIFVNSEDTIIYPFKYKILILGTSKTDLQKQLLSFSNDLEGKLVTPEDDTLSSIDTMNMSAILILPQSNLTKSELQLLNSFTKPMIVCDYTSLFTLHMAMSEDAWNVGYDSASSMIIGDDSHPILNGVFSEFDVEVICTTHNGAVAKLGWSEPGSPAKKVAVGVKDQDHQHIFTLETNDKMADDFTIPARRIAFLVDSGILTTNGEALYKSSLQWLLGEL